MFGVAVPSSVGRVMSVESPFSPQVHIAGTTFVSCFDAVLRAKDVPLEENGGEDVGWPTEAAGSVWPRFYRRFHTDEPQEWRRQERSGLQEEGVLPHHGDLLLGAEPISFS